MFSSCEALLMKDFSAWKAVSILSSIPFSVRMRSSSSSLLPNVFIRMFRLFPRMRFNSFEHVFQGMQNAVGIDSSDEIDESATHQQQEQGEQEDVFLNVASVIIACHDQYDEVAFIVGIVEGGTPQIAVDERNRKVFEQACLLVAVEIFVQRVVHGADALSVFSNISCACGSSSSYFCWISR